MSLYGGMSKGERMRIKTGVRTAMASQASSEGRFLGGRPPYGYLLQEVGPHPDLGRSARGQQLRRLSPDPIAGPIVQRTFAEYQSGRVLIDGMRNIIKVLAHADPVDKAELHAEVGVKLRYEPSGRVSVEALPDGHEVRVGGGT